jgi:hypothetical protein
MTMRSTDNCHSRCPPIGEPAVHREYQVRSDLKGGIGHRKRTSDPGPAAFERAGCADDQRAGQLRPIDRLSAFRHIAGGSGSMTTMARPGLAQPGEIECW